ncbi:MAG: hypothetical protein KAH24_07325, partial [Holophagae bacterium]|nr:hypothetical protein [Holophagae bacterium]
SRLFLTGHHPFINRVNLKHEVFSNFFLFSPPVRVDIPIDSTLGFAFAQGFSIHLFEVFASFC